MLTSYAVLCEPSQQRSWTCPRVPGNLRVQVIGISCSNLRSSPSDAAFCSAMARYPTTDYRHNPHNLRRQWVEPKHRSRAEFIGHRPPLLGHARRYVSQATDGPRGVVGEPQYLPVRFTLAPHDIETASRPAHPEVSLPSKPSKIDFSLDTLSNAPRMFLKRELRTLVPGISTHPARSDLSSEIIHNKLPPSSPPPRPPLQ